MYLPPPINDWIALSFPTIPVAWPYRNNHILCFDVFFSVKEVRKIILSLYQPRNSLMFLAVFKAHKGKNCFYTNGRGKNLSTYSTSASFTNNS